MALLAGRLLPRTSLGLPGALTLGGLGGVIIGELRDHITGAHHHVMNGQDMPGMSMAPPLAIVPNLVWCAGGGALFLLLAYMIRKFVPD